MTARRGWHPEEYYPPLSELLGEEGKAAGLDDLDWVGVRALAGLLENA